MKMKSFVKSLLSVLSFLFLTNAVPSTSIYSLFILFVLYCAFDSVPIDKNPFTRIGSAIFGIFAVLNVFQVNVYDDVLGSRPLFLQVIVVLIIFAGTYLLVEMILSFLFSKFDQIKTVGSHPLKPNTLLLISFLVLILFYLPAWMMEYPSNVSADTLDQIGQILSGKYINHHPFAHTMWLKLLMSFGKDINIRVGIAALVQLVINVFVFSFVVRTVYVKTQKFSYALLTLLFYLLASYHAFYSITLIKDVSHATIACILLMLLIQYFDVENKKTKNLYLIFIGIFSVFFCLFRTNGYYAFVVMIVSSALYVLKKKDYRLITALVLAFILSTAIKGPVYDALNIAKASFAESISVPVQQIALVVRNGGSIDDNEMKMLNKVIDVNKAAEDYDAFLSDPVKRLLNDGDISYLEENKSDYLKVWIGIGMKNPFEYLQAWVNQWSGYFSPHYYATSAFWGVWENGFGIHASPILIKGQLNETLHDLAYNQHDLPFIGWLHYPSITTWMLMICLLYCLRNKDYETLIIVSPLVGIFITLMISCPYNLCFRYYYAVVCCIPLFVAKALLAREAR